VKRLLVPFLCALALAGAPVLRAGQTVPEGPDPVLVGAGDIADCGEIEGAEKTAALLDHIPGTVFTLGDNAYTSGTAKQFRDCYGPTWGRHLERTRPAVGNHDYRTKGAAAYFAYFGAAAGPPDKGYYSYDLGKWHVVVLNSNCSEVGGCGADSAQERWLRRDLAEHPALCTAAMWHHPRFSSAEHGDDPGLRYLWKALYEGGAELVLSGHDHTYERFAPEDADGNLDPARGIRQFVVGTGGRHEYEFENIEKNSEVRDNRTFGVLKLTLHPDSYDWQFVPVEGGTFTDSGTAKCH
jgi:3',5'-cyclic AMP phosphodiesterase CpdA